MSVSACFCSDKAEILSEQFFAQNFNILFDIILDTQKYITKFKYHIFVLRLILRH